MKLNTLSPSPGSKHYAKRVGRGQGSGLGKTCTRGHKGQKSRKSGPVPAGFEGGQMPLHRRLPKFGFKSHIARSTTDINLSQLSKVEGDVIDTHALRQATFIKHTVKRIRVFLSGKIDRPITLRGVGVTAGAKKAIEAAGGKVE